MSEDTKTRLWNLYVDTVNFLGLIGEIYLICLGILILFVIFL